MRLQQRSFAAAAAAFVLLAAGPASADPTPRECIAAADRGQLLQKNHNLTLARETYRTCAAPSCPTEVQRACIGWLDVADKAQPTLAFSIKDSAGNDLSDVTVTVDDQPFVSKTAGTAVEVDPGEHTFKFVAEGYEPLTRKVVIVEGEKMRRVRVELAKIGGDPPPVAPVPARRKPSAAPEDAAPDPGAPREHSSAQKTAGILVLAAGGAAIATGVGFTIDYVINKTNLSTDSVNNYGVPTKDGPVTDPCFVHGPTNATTNDGCTAQTNAATAEDVLIATYIAGGVIAIVGITLIATAPSDNYGSGHAARWLKDIQVVPAVSPGHASMLLTGRF